MALLAQAVAVRWGLRSGRTPTGRGCRFESALRDEVDACAGDEIVEDASHHIRGCWSARVDAGADPLPPSRDFGVGRRRSGLPVALAMIDIDHFKLYYDHYGHAAGDHCLQRVATELGRETRDADLVARYGGEEFALVMPYTDVATASRSAERLRTTVATLAVPHTSATERIVTVSICVAAMAPRWTALRRASWTWRTSSCIEPSAAAATRSGRP